MDLLKFNNLHITLLTLFRKSVHSFNAIFYLLLLCTILILFRQIEQSPQNK